MMIGIVSGLLTLFLGFIGTFIVRFAILKQPFEKTILPTLIHFVLNAMAVIPVIGLVTALIANIYFVWVNFKMTLDAH